jgi:hypothetical protein
MRRASFKVPTPAGEAEVSVTSFPGDAGGLEANVNRWRSQAGLAPLSPAALEASASRVKTAAGEARVVSFSGPGGSAPGMPGSARATAGPTAIAGAMLAHRGATWFFKMSGPAGAVGAATPAFTDLVRGLRPAGAR